MVERNCTRCKSEQANSWGLSHSPEGEQYCQQCLDNHWGRY